MTPVDLIYTLADFCRTCLADIILPVPEDSAPPCGERAVRVHEMDLPMRGGFEGEIPYVLLQLVTGKDDGQDNDADCTCKIRVVVATYNKSPKDGRIQVLNIITRLRTALHEAGVLGGQFTLRDPLEYLVHPDRLDPYYTGEMMLIFGIPRVRRNVRHILERS